MPKSARNKTIDFPIEEGQEYLKRCIQADGSGQIALGQISAPSRQQADGSETMAGLRNQFIIGDCLAVMEQLPKSCVDLLIVDPPYNLDKDYHGDRFARRSTDDYRSFTIQWIEKVLPLLKPDASIYVCCDWKSSLIIGDVLQDYFHVQNRITWQREKGRGAKANWKNSMEDIWFATVGDTYTFNLEAVMQRRKVVAPYRKEGQPKDWEETESGNFRNTCPSNFWDDISIPYWSMAENTAHPTQKPEKLIAKLILASSHAGDLVLDPFAGSGTTAVVAKKLGRDYLVIEQNERYAAWAQKRLEMADEDGSIQGYTNGVFWERNSLADQKKEGKNR